MSKIYTRQLPVTITQDQFNTRSKELADELQAKADDEQNQRHVKAAWKNMLEAHDVRISTLRRIIKTGQETRDVECQDTKNLTEKIMETIRIDNGERVEYRALTEGELQREMAFEREAH